MTAALVPALVPPPVPAGLSHAATAAVAAYTADETPAGRLDLLALVPLVSDLLNGAALLLAHKNALADELDLELMAQAVAELIQFRFGGLKPSELSQAFRRGAGGQYRADPAEVLYLSLPTISNWLYAYQTTARHEAIQALRKADEPPALPAAPRDHAAELVALVAQAQAGQLPAAEALDYANVLYEWLKTAGALAAPRWPCGPPDYEAIRAEEAEALMEKPQPLNKAERRQRTTFIDILADGGKWPDGHPLAKTVANACKKRVLREWLLQCAAEETDVPALLASITDPAAPLAVGPRTIRL